MKAVMKVVLFGCSAVTLLLRGANDYMLDEVDRALHDALCIVKRVLETRSVVPGGGAVEAGLSIYLENFADMLGSKEQLAINEFAQALLVIPKTLAVNAAKDATELVAKLRTYHNHAQRSEDKRYLGKARPCRCPRPCGAFAVPLVL
jgi:T-complex protein 1 subunit alpha